jgi:hypothetical protein
MPESELRIQNPKVNGDSGREGGGFQSKSGMKMGTGILNKEGRKKGKG